MKKDEIISTLNSHVMPSYGRLDVALEKGNNSQVTDSYGAEYIDFGSGIGTNSLGFCDEDWVESVCNQVRQLQHTSNYYYTKVQAEFAEKLAKATGYSKMFFGNSGAEANECAIKIARKYSFDKYGKGRHKIIALENSFHGRTLATLSATGQESFHQYFFPFVEGFDYAKANDIDHLKSKIDDTVCGIFLEYIQGEGGVIPLNQDFVDAVFALGEERDILIIADEVQTGAGRTGKFLAGEHYGKQADITTLAKGIAGGVPIGICLGNEKTANVLTTGTHGSTFGGNPIACAGGMAVINKVLQPDFLLEVEKKAELIRKTLTTSKEVVEISGKGLMLGITLKSKKASEVLQKALEQGLLILTAKEKIRLLPPLTIGYEQLEKGLSILMKILDE